MACTTITGAMGPHGSWTLKGEITHMLITIKNRGVCARAGLSKQQQQLRFLSSCKVLGRAETQHVFPSVFTTAPTVFLNNVVSQMMVAQDRVHAMHKALGSHQHKEIEG